MRVLAGESTPDEESAVRRELASHPDRAALLEALDRSLAPADIAPPTAAEVEAALAAVNARRAMTAVRGAGTQERVAVLDVYRSRWYGARTRAAAAVLVIAGAGLVWRIVSGPSAAMTPAQHYATAAGQIDSVHLADGTAVLLGPGSELQVHEGFGNAARDVTLRGEARFSVAHDATRPFTVHTDHATFRDVGTVFSVHSDSGDGARVVVTQGAVAVATTGANDPVTLGAGDRAELPSDGPMRVERAAAVADDTAWTSGRLVFRDAPVGQVVADVKRWYGVTLMVDAALGARRVTADFDRSSGAQVAAVVAATLGGHVSSSGDTLRILRGAASAPAR